MSRNPVFCQSCTCVKSFCSELQVFPSFVQIARKTKQRGLCWRDLKYSVSYSYSGQKRKFYKYWCKWKICHFYRRNLFINKSFSIWRWTLISILSWHSLVNSCPQELVHLDHGPPYSCQLIIWGAYAICICTDLMLNISSISTVSSVLITITLSIPSNLQFTMLSTTRLGELYIHIDRVWVNFHCSVSIE